LHVELAPWSSLQLARVRSTPHDDNTEGGMSEQSHSLRAELERAQSTLKKTLDQACSADLGEADTGELIRIEEVLAIANRAAKDAVSVRRRIAANHAHDDEGPASREIEDDRGVRWLVFAVYPLAERSGRSVMRAAYRAGWLSFDCGIEIRRLAPIPVDWDRLSTDELLTLLSTAEPAPRRPSR
jgi:hypothetical protein